MNAIEVSHFSKRYHAVMAVDDLTFSIPRGRLVGLLGPNGAGKTTTMMIVYAIAPVSAVFYPVATLPAWLQAIAFILPSSHIFEGMRSIIIHGTFDAAQMVWAIGLNIMYMVIGVVVLWLSIQNARNRGSLLMVGE